MKISTRIVGSLFIVVILLFSTEFGAYVLVEFLVSKRAAYLVYQKPNFTEGGYKAYLNVRDPQLGWPTTTALKSAVYDSSGSRPIPAFPEPGQECVTIYGDSFTYGSEVSDKDAWGNVLAKGLQCRVGNFGVPGYGTDQALLRFQENRQDIAPVSILGIFPHNVLRNVNQYRYLLAPSKETSYRFKPRFILKKGQLHRIPLPEPSFSRLKALDTQMSQMLPHEAFLPGNGTGPVPKKQFFYSFTALKLLLNERVQNWVLKKPSWEVFTRRNHSSGASEITVAVVQGFMEECKKRGKNCFIVTFPTPSSYKKFAMSGRLSMATILKRFDGLGIPYLTFESYISENLKEEKLCDLLTNPEKCAGHLNREGSQVLAEFLSTYIIQNSMLGSKKI
ncbi:MAG: hypothetical protein ACE5FU_02615 [Nitrospinota bacterium]